MSRPRNQERHEKILAMWKESPNSRRIADAFGLDVGTIHHYLHLNGIPTPRKGRVMNSACEKNREIVLRLFREGKTLTSIADLVKTNVSRVAQFLRRNGVTHIPHGRPAKEDHWLWGGGWRVNKDGYIEIYVDQHPNHRKYTKYILEHRLVMEKAIGRYLLRTEVVHHKNGVKDDNRIENLQLFSENSEHLRHELTGRCPKWTPEGRERTLQANRQRKGRKYAKTRKA